MTHRQLSANRNGRHRTSLCYETLALDLAGLKVADVNLDILIDFFEVGEEDLAARFHKFLVSNDPEFVRRRNSYDLCRSPTNVIVRRFNRSRQREIP